MDQKQKAPGGADRQGPEGDEVHADSTGGEHQAVAIIDRLVGNDGWSADDARELRQLPLHWPQAGDGLKLPAPGYQEIASKMMSLEHFKCMSLAERGLFYSARLYCWCNGSMPSDRGQLSRVLGLDEDTVEDALTKRVLTFFIACEGNPDRLHCPELTMYMFKLLRSRKSQVDGGKKGGKKSAEIRSGKGSGKNRR